MAETKKMQVLDNLELRDAIMEMLKEDVINFDYAEHECWVCAHYKLYDVTVDGTICSNDVRVEVRCNAKDSCLEMVATLSFYDDMGVWEAASNIERLVRGYRM